MRDAISYAVLLLGILCAAAAAAQDKPKPLDQVNAYAADHDAKVTVHQQDRIWFVEADGLDAFGTGKTIDEAAEDFMHCADMIDHEPADPAHKAAQCPDDQGCI